LRFSFCGRGVFANGANKAMLIFAIADGSPRPLFKIRLNKGPKLYKLNSLRYINLIYGFSNLK
jgi:hypothetical protein